MSIVSRIMSIIFICFGFVSVPPVDYYAAEDVDDYSPARCVYRLLIYLGFGFGVWGVIVFLFCFVWAWFGRVGVR